MKIAKSKRFDKQYSKLSKKVKLQVDERLRLFVYEPNSPLLRIHSLVGEFAGLKSFNVNSDVRVIYEQEADIIIILVAVGTHSQLY